MYLNVGRSVLMILVKERINFTFEGTDRVSYDTIYVNVEVEVFFQYTHRGDPNNSPSIEILECLDDETGLEVWDRLTGLDQDLIIDKAYARAKDGYREYC